MLKRLFFSTLLLLASIMPLTANYRMPIAAGDVATFCSSVSGGSPAIHYPCVQLVDATGAAFNSISVKESALATYRASMPWAPATNANVAFFVSASATKTVKIRRLLFHLHQTTAGLQSLIVGKYSVAPTGGTFTELNKVSLDGGDVAATAIVRTFTVDPTGGTGLGNIFNAQVPVPATGAGAFIKEFNFGANGGKPFILRAGTGDTLSLHLGGTTPSAGLVITVEVEFTEE